MSTAMNISIPSFIDTSVCLCGILASGSSLSNNGELPELWRCIGNASANISAGTNGKWWNTSLPSEELSGLNEPQYWAENPPDLSQAYVLVQENGQSAYQKLSGTPSELIGADVNCNGRNDTSLSGTYYAKGIAGLNLTTPASSTTTSSTVSMTSSASKASNKASTSSTGSSSPSPTTAASPASIVDRVTLRSLFVLSIVIAPSLALVM